MIGDDIVSDVGGAQACGIRGVQARTGKYRYHEAFFLFCTLGMHFLKDNYAP